MSNPYLRVDWPAPPNIQAWQTTRAGGCSEGGYSSFNLANTVGDDAQHVATNRQDLISDLSLPSEPAWIRLVHGARVVDVSAMESLEEADATYTNRAGQVLLIPTADCLPVLFCSKRGDEVAAAHAGWRGLSAGVLENTAAAFQCLEEDILAWFGPAIGPTCFEVGEDVREAFQASHPGSNAAFAATDRAGKYYADLYALGRFALERVGVNAIYGGEHCTYQDERFFSYRRQGMQSGRMASIVWISPD